MRFDQLYGGRREVGGLVGALQCIGLAFRHWCIDALGTSIGTGANAREHCVDAVAISLCVVQALERYHAETFSQHGAVGLVRERTAIATSAERGSLGEAHVHEDVVEGVYATGDYEVGIA